MTESLAKHECRANYIGVKQIGGISAKNCIRYVFTWAKHEEAFNAWAIVFAEWWVKCDPEVDPRGWRANDMKWYAPKDHQLPLCSRLGQTTPGQRWEGYDGPKSNPNKPKVEAKAKGDMSQFVFSGQIGQLNVNLGQVGPNCTFSSSGQTAGPSASLFAGQAVGPNASLGPVNQGQMWGPPPKLPPGAREEFF